MSTCTIATHFLGIDLGPCGDPASRTTSGRCERGHTRTRTVCAHHAKAFEALPQCVACEQCADEGHDVPMTVTAEATR